MYVYLYVQVVGFIKWTLRSWLWWCSMVWTCSLHAGWHICIELLKILLVHTGGKDETWISPKIE